MATTRLYDGLWPSGIRVRWRGLTLAEHEKFVGYLLSGMPAAQVHLEVYDAVLVSGPIPEEVPAGIVLWIGRQLLDQSALTGRLDLVKARLAQKRQLVQNSYLLAVKGYLSSLFHYRFEDMDSWDEDTFFERVAQAEFVLGRPLEPTDPNTKQERSQARPKGARRLSTPRPSTDDSAETATWTRSPAPPR